MTTDISMKDIRFDAASTATEFYRYAYTSLLNRHVISSCELVIDSGEALQRNIESLLSSMQELVYNSSASEKERTKALIQEPGAEIRACAESLADALSALRRYKLSMLSSENL